MLGKIKDKIKHYCLTIINVPNFIKNKILEFKNYISDCKYKLSHLTETNYQLGLDHLYRGNLNDALLRFKLVDKFFNPNDSKVYSQLGWVYFLKNNYRQAIEYLEKSNEKYKPIFINFLKNYKDITEIPQEICGKYRDLTAQYYPTIFNNDKNIHLPYRFVNEALKQISDLPDNYSILELGSNIGLVGYEIQKRFPERFTLTGVEVSALMNKLQETYYPNTKIYDQIYNIAIDEFLKQNSNKFDIIFSFCGLSFTNNLIEYFNLIYSSLNTQGYFALCLPNATKTQFSVKRKEFIFNLNEINNFLQKNNFTILTSEEIILAENNKYSIIVCKKTA
ncbi:methyltransferase domain-containing protein [Rickettsia rickettsii]|uniref:methyltransferase domain-containing protein n=1 Tax=Rickettsia rickettsii TaxID=783 RepID=UPI00024F9DA2|nr:methyltransferase domain-containing protein [Rickettsia rickettsii]AFB28441.1 SAM-dependent methyltransferase [Rickettsia rickettsii str. Hlp\